MNLRQKKKKVLHPDFVTSTSTKSTALALVPVPVPALAMATGRRNKRTRGRTASLPSSTNGNTKPKPKQRQGQGQNKSVVRQRNKSVNENGTVSVNGNGNSTANGHVNGNGIGNYYDFDPRENGHESESDNDSFTSSDYECVELPSIVRDAIMTLNENGGSTLDSILNFIRETYPKVDLDLFTPFLMGYLEDAVMAGKIQRKRKAYQLVTKKRKRKNSSEEEEKEESFEYDYDDENPISEVTLNECQVVLKPLRSSLIVPVLLRNFCHTQNLFNYTSSARSGSGIGDDEDYWSLSHEFFASEPDSASESVSSNSRQFYIHLHDDRIIQADGPIHIQIQSHSQNQNQYQDQNEPGEMDEQKSEEKGMPKIIRRKLKIVKAMILKPFPNCFLALEVRDVNLFTPEIQDLLAFTQNSITHFCFGKKLYSDRLIRENILLDFITKHLSQLKYLAICDDMIDSWDDLTQSASTVTCNNRPLLVQLKTLRLIQNRRNNQVFTQTFFSEILQCAPNLEEIYGLPLKHLNLVEMNKKIKAVKSISGFYESGKSKASNRNQNQHQNQENEKNSNNISNNNNSDNTDTDLFSDSMKILSRTKPQCELLDLRGMSKDRKNQPKSTRAGKEEFEFEFEKETGTKILDIYTNLLLQCSYGYLKKLKVCPLGAKLINVRFPTLDTVTDLQIVIECKGEDLSTQIFPPGWDLNRIFPSLSNVEIKFDWTGIKTSLDWKYLKKMNVVNIIPKTSMENGPPSIFLSVTHLLLTNSMMRVQLCKLGQIFQNIQKFSIRLSSNLLKHRLPFIFLAWPKLKELNLELDVACAHVCLDSALLGISEANLKHLEREKYPDLTEEDERKYRIYSSICQLTDLEILRFSFYRQGGIFREKKTISESKWGFFTPALGIYGTYKDIMPNLNVRVKFDASCTSNDICELLNMWTPLTNLISIEM